MSNKRIYLTGFMGSGKSTIGPILANVLGWEFSDLDKLIETELNDSVSNVFLTRGELFFREIESLMLRRTVEADNLVLALGGGTLTTAGNLELIKKTGISVYLKSSPDEIYRRLQFKTDRPLLKSESEIPLSAFETKAKISELLRKREPTYLHADIIYVIDNLSVGKTVDGLVNLLNRKFRL
ncbi:MAG: shikimate kinase [Ignavibacteriaceae bacterium]